MARLSLISGARSPSRALIATEHLSAHPRRRVEIVSTGVDEDLQGVGSDPYGSMSWVGLRVPALVTVGPQNRYLFLLCSIDVADGDRARIVGLRHGYSLGIRQAGPRTNEFWVQNPIFKPPRGGVSWHLRVRPLHQLNNPGNGPVQPPLQNFAFRDAQSPALLYNTAAAALFYPLLTAYTPPNAGQPYGRGATPELATFFDLKSDWQDAADWHALDVPIVGPARIQFFASVQQIPLAKHPVIQPVAPAVFFPLGESAEEQYLANFAESQIWRVAGALALEFDDGAQLRSMIDHPSQWTGEPKGGAK